MSHKQIEYIVDFPGEMSHKQIENNTKLKKG